MTTQLSTLAALKAFMGLKDTIVDRDALLSELLTQCSAQIENFCQRTFGSNSYTEYYDGNGSDLLLTSQYPVTAVVSVEVNGQPIAAAANGQAVGYRFFEHEVVLNLGARFTRGRRNVKVVYTAGFTVIPDDLVLVVHKLVSNAYKGRDWIGFSSKSLAGESVSFSYKDEIDKPAQRMVLNNYRRVAPL